MLPYDILESQIFYYLDGNDIRNLSRINTEYYTRLNAVQILNKLKIKSIWPELVILQDDTVNQQEYRKLSQLTWVFPKIVVPSDLYCVIHDCIPACKDLKIFTTANTNYTQLADVVYKSTELYCYRDMTNLQLLSLARQDKQWNLKSLHFSSSLLFSHSKIYAMFKLILYESITKLEISGGLSFEGFGLILDLLDRRPVLDYNAQSVLNSENLLIGDIKPKIESLVLSRNNLEGEHLNALSTVLPFSTVKELQISFNDFSPSDLCILFDHLPNTEIEIFHYYNKVDIASNLHFIAALPKSKLKSVTLQLAPEFIDDFLKSCIHSKLNEFQFINPIGNYGVNELQSLKYTKLTKLCLNNSGISDTETLMTCLIGSRVQVLELNDNMIGLKGITNIATKLHGTCLKSIALENCGIPDKGALILGSNLKRSKIVKLYLKHNILTSYGIMNLLSQMKKHHVLFLEATWVKTRSRNDETVLKLKATYPGHIILHEM
ncbi:hypothetical protein HK103_003962 [Boothiomyces macroporosus]|uniref:Uncharacterized protein n=1 Tax=Boothiomyces macroporosus TaxID=261099 RepID=A0AAD5UL13_9FUNG|nr:hypothetical protein HK103_003962 [Boothiomyces macroporosus]